MFDMIAASGYGTLKTVGVTLKLAGAGIYAEFSYLTEADVKALRDALQTALKEGKAEHRAATADFRKRNPHLKVKT
jgi:hypothetical protein